VTAEVALARNPAAVVSATSIPSAKKSPAVAAPTPVGRTGTAAARGAVVSAVDPVAAADITDVTPARVSKAALAPAAVAAPEASRAVVAPSKTPNREADTAKVAAAEASATEVATPPDSGTDDQLPAVRVMVDPAEADADGIVFRIELSRPAEQPVVLIYGTVDGTAKAGEDYQSQQGVVTPRSRKSSINDRGDHPEGRLSRGRPPSPLEVGTGGLRRFQGKYDATVRARTDYPAEV
jgi:hypothetical protein